MAQGSTRGPPATRPSALVAGACRRARSGPTRLARERSGYTAARGRERRTTDATPRSIARGFLFADLRGYSAWVERHGDHAAAALLREYRDLVRRAVAEHQGAEIKTEGDSFYVAFDSPSAAVRCGRRILELAATSTAANGAPIPVGVGIHAGETVATDEGFVGSAVNIAARVCAEARVGELLVTDAVRSLTRTYLDVGFESRGRRRLKGIPEPMGLYRVVESAGHVVGASRLRAVLPRWPIAVAAIGTLLIVVVASALIGGALVRESAGDPGASPSPHAGSSHGEMSPPPAPSAPGEPMYPTADEARLLELLGERDQRQCQRATSEDVPILEYAIRAEARAGIECDLGGITAPDQVWYWHLVPSCQYACNPAGVAIAAQGGRVGAAPGTCREERPSLETWGFGGISGKLVCYETSTGDAVVMWAYDDDEGRWLFAKAVRDDRDMTALLDWWEDVGRFAAP